ncbi:Uncharacterized protein Fot_33983 [Forsythia ovata]|uniref:Uncharacterized protein n=1 Tax=Forsythia ovata TaxID=205694 RepID=A0ABD1TC82_9LAMI
MIDASTDMLNSIVMKKSYILPTPAIISCPPGDKFTKIKEVQELLLMNTGWTTTTVIGEAVEKFFDCSAEELMHKDTMEDRPNNVPVFCTHIEYEHVVYVKSANRGTIPNQTLFDVIFILDSVTVIKATKAFEFPLTNKQSSSLSISTIPGEESNSSSVRRVLFGTSSEPQEKKKQKQEESMHPDDHVNSHNVDTNNYSFSDATTSMSN